MRGASALQDALDTAGAGEVAVWVVWERVLPTDLAPPSNGVLARVRYRGAAQYWDPELLGSRAFLRTALAHRERLPAWMELDEDAVIWDLVAVYPPGPTWQDLPPFPGQLAVPVVDAKEKLAGWLREAAPPR